MPATDDIETRLTAVEREVARFRERVAITDTVAGSAHVLAAGADRELSEARAELRSHIQVINALRETQLEQGLDIAAVRTEMAALRTEMAAVRTEMAALRTEMHERIDGLEREVREGFSILGTGMAQITALLTNPGE